jgi:peptidyl-prolyl cis-trans isomerase C
LLAAGVIGYGYWDTNVRPKSETVLQVGDTSFSLGYFERRVHYVVVETGYVLPEDLTGSQLQQLLGVLLEQLITQVETGELTRQGARDLAITATDQEIDDEIAQRQGVPSDAEQEAFLAAYRAAVRESGLSTEDFRSIMEAAVLDGKIRDRFLEEAPDSVEQVRFRLILVASEEEAQDLVARLDAGEDFGDLARDLSLDVATQEQGGERDWTPLDTLTGDFRTALSELEVGETSEVIANPQGFVVLEPLEKAAERETADDQKAALANRAFSDWLDELRSRVEVVNSLDQDQTNTLLQKWLKETQRVPGG